MMHGTSNINVDGSLHNYKTDKLSKEISFSSEANGEKEIPEIFCN
jgi:hypothetical protein